SQQDAGPQPRSHRPRRGGGQIAMGMSTGGGSPNGVKNDINVTPLIDVLLVLLIIFLVIIPIMMKMETLTVPRNIDTDELPDPDASQLTIKVNADLSMTFSDGTTETPI